MSEYVIFREDETGQLRLVERCSEGDCYMMGWTPKVIMSDIVPKTEMATFEGEHELCEYALRALQEDEDDGQPKERDMLRGRCTWRWDGKRHRYITDCGEEVHVSTITDADRFCRFCGRELSRLRTNLIQEESDDVQ